MKKNTILSVLTGLCAVLFLVNCGGDSAGGEGVKLSVSPTSVTLEPNGSAKIMVTSNTSWTASSSGIWLSINPNRASGGREIEIAVNSPNNTGANRQAIITFTDDTGTVSARVTVTEKASGSTPDPDPFLGISPSKLNFASSGGSNSFSITSNVSWTVKSNESWCTVSPSSGSNNGNVTVNVAENPNTTSRSATIEVLGEGGLLSKTITVNQDAKQITYTLDVSPSSLSFAAAGETKNITVTSNDSWTVSSNQSWCTVSPSSGSNNGTIKVTAAANSSTSSRSATITIKGANSGTKTVSVAQEGAQDDGYIGRDEYGDDDNLNNK